MNVQTKILVHMKKSHAKEKTSNKIILYKLNAGEVSIKKQNTLK